jgi:hypothetical protein
MSACNDLILLRYGWGQRPGDGSGQTDCFQLACEVRRRLGLHDLSADFAWVYQTYTEETLPRRRLIRWLLEHCKRVASPLPGDLALFRGTRAGALAVATEEGGLVYLRESGWVGHAPAVPVGIPLFRHLP